MTSPLWASHSVGGRSLNLQSCCENQLSQVGAGRAKAPEFTAGEPHLGTEKCDFSSLSLFPRLLPQAAWSFLRAAWDGCPEPFSSREMLCNSLFSSFSFDSHQRAFRSRRHIVIIWGLDILSLSGVECRGFIHSPEKRSFFTCRVPLQLDHAVYMSGRRRSCQQVAPAGPVPDPLPGPNFLPSPGSC